MEQTNFFQKSIISNVIWKFAERVIAQLVSLSVSILLARLLLPEHYGVVSMVMVFISFANVFVSDGIPTALIQKKDADLVDFSSVFYFNLFLSLLIYISLFIAAPFIAEFYHEQELVPILRVLSVRIIVASVNSVQHSYVARHMMFKKYFWSTLYGTLLSGVVGIIMAYQGFGVWALVAQYMTNTTVDTLVLFITVNWRPQLVFDLRRVKGLFKFGWRILCEGLSNTFALQIRNLVIGRVYTSDDLAYFSKGQQFPSLIVTNIAISIGSVLFPAMANEQDDKEKVLVILRKSIKMSTYIIYPMLFGLATVAAPLVSILLTDKWIEVVPFMQFFCLINLAIVGMIPRHQALNGIGRSDVFMNEHIIARLISLCLLVAVYKISVFAIMISSIIGAVVQVLIVAYTSRKYNYYRYRDQIKDILPVIIGCIIMSGSIYFIRFLGLSNVYTLIIQIVGGAIIYYIYSKMIKLEAFEICRQYIKSFFERFMKQMDRE